jgi:type II secretory pathway pseudopilin PulG
MSKYKLGLTLFELLVSIFILSTLLAVLTSALLRPKKSAKTMVDVSNLRQIGLAMEMYREQHDSVSYVSSSLIKSGQVDKNIFRSPLDQVEEGFANRYVRNVIALMDKSNPYLNLPIPVSYIGVDAYRLESAKCLQLGNGAGWMIRTHDLSLNGRGPSAFHFYLLLGIDGSVRSMKPKSAPRDGGFEVLVEDIFCPS